MGTVIPHFWVEQDWIEPGINALHNDGVFVLSGVLPKSKCEIYSKACLDSLEQIKTEIGLERLSRAKEVGVARFPPKQSPVLYELLDIDEVHQLVDKVIGTSSIAHLMNAICLPSNDPSSTEVFQGKLHRDFPRFLGGTILSVNAFICLSDFVADSGSTRFVVGSHQLPDVAPPIDRQDISVSAPMGSIIFFDSTIWHAGGINIMDSIRVGVNTQWTHHWIKQQIDLVRHVGLDQLSELPARIQRALGMHSRVVTSLEEYYVRPEQRLYRSGQG